MMTARTARLLRDELARRTYKPGYQMRFHDASGVGLRFALTLTTADSYHPDRQIPLCFEVYVPTDPLTTTTGEVDVPRFSDWLRHVLRQFEAHEVDEWHRRDGELVVEAHAERPFGRPA